MKSRNVISFLMQIVRLFGAFGYINSDKGKSFILQKFVSFMHNLQILTSKTSVYNPAFNGQCEKYNNIICSGVKLAIKNQNLVISKREVVLLQILHYVCSLLCTATDSTPHKRFFNSVLGISTPSWLKKAFSNDPSQAKIHQLILNMIRSLLSCHMWKINLFVENLIVTH